MSRPSAWLKTLAMEPPFRLFVRKPTEHSVSHRCAGELLAIDEFNRTNDHVTIDHWRGIKNDRPFPEASFLQKM